MSTSTALIIAQVTSSTDVTCAAEISYAGDVGGTDQFTGVITPAASSTYSYTVRFDGNWGATNPNAGWRYADLDGAGNGFDYENVGELTVIP